MKDYYNNLNQDYSNNKQEKEKLKNNIKTSQIKYKINRSSINSKEISKNNCTIKKCFPKKQNDSIKKIFKIKIRSNNRESKNSKSMDKSKEKNRDKRTKTILLSCIFFGFFNK